MNSEVKHKEIYLVNKENIWSNSNFAVFSGESDSDPRGVSYTLQMSPSIKGAPRLVLEEDTLLMWHMALKMTCGPC